MQTIRRQVRITGQVQGVWFRDGLARRARALGVSGSVANHDDGSVVAQLQGDPDAVEAGIDWCRSGSPNARVDDVTITDAEVIDGEIGFDVR